MRIVLLVKFVVMSFSPCSVLFHRPKYSLQHFVLRRPISLFFPRETAFHAYKIIFLRIMVMME
jgi:hypothetical protein